MTKIELRKKVIEFFTEKNIDYDGSQNTMTLYRWAVRNHEFERIEEFEPKKKEVIESHSDQIIDKMNEEKHEEIIEETTESGKIEFETEKQSGDDSEQNPQTEEKKQDSKAEPEKKNTLEKVTKKEEKPKTEPDEKTDEQNNNQLYWIIAVMALLFVGIALYNYVNGNKEQ